MSSLQIVSRHFELATVAQSRAQLCFLRRLQRFLKTIKSCGPRLRCAICLLQFLVINCFLQCLAFFQEFFQRGIYCHANLFCNANFSTVLGPNYRGGQNSEGGKLPQCGRKPGVATQVARNIASCNNSSRQHMFFFEVLNEEDANIYSAKTTGSIKRE